MIDGLCQQIDRFVVAWLTQSSVTAGIRRVTGAG
jgi:hypothetical protein